MDDVVYCDHIFQRTLNLHSVEHAIYLSESVNSFEESSVIFVELQIRRKWIENEPFVFQILHIAKVQRVILNFYLIAVDISEFVRVIVRFRLQA